MLTSSHAYNFLVGYIAAGANSPGKSGQHYRKLLKDLERTHGSTGQEIAAEIREEMTNAEGSAAHG